MRLFPFILLSACAFSTDVPGEDPEEEEPDVVMPTPSTRCQAAGLAVCVDFEDMPAPKDGIAPEVALTAQNITPQLRETDEHAAALAIKPTVSELRIANAAKLDIAQHLTIELWTKPAVVPADSGDGQVGLFDVSAQYQMNFESDRQIECRIFGVETDNVDSDALAINAWHHVACTFDGATLQVYVDGKLQGCKQVKAGARTILTAPSFGAAIGSNMLGTLYRNPFIGELDNVHLYNRTLSAAEICTLWGHGNCSDTCPTGGGGPGGGPGNDDD